MRLNSRAAILAYLGKSPQNRGAWRRTRLIYAGALRWLPGSFRVWALTEELDGVDRERSLTLAEVKVAQRGHGEGHGGRDFVLERVAERLGTRTRGT